LSYQNWPIKANIWDPEIKIKLDPSLLPAGKQVRGDDNTKSGDDKKININIIYNNQERFAMTGIKK